MNNFDRRSDVARRPARTSGPEIAIPANDRLATPATGKIALGETAANEALAAEPGAMAAARLPLCVDLDGTLIRTDTLAEGLIALTVRLRWAAIIGGLTLGAAGMKARVARLAPTDPALLPFNEAMLDYVRAERDSGRLIVLTTAANEATAERIADYLSLFDEVIASTPERNLKGRFKAAALVDRFGAGGFVYAGDAGADLPVWRQAAASVLVNVRRSVAARARAETPVEHVIDDQPSVAASLARAMRPHRWIKNLLAFVPIFAAGALTDWPAWVGGVLAFVALCAVTSSMYLVNDLIDLSADREHARKRHRALASGKASLPAGIALAAVLLLIGALFGWACGIPHVLAGYVAVSLAYSLWLKRQPLLDVFALAGLYTLRLVGGGEAAGHRLSLWLLASAGFLFLSLALIKRVAEVMDRSARATDAAPRTDYGLDDLMILELFGVCATFASSLVLALYVQYELTDDSFAAPGLLWCTVPLVLLWNCRMWLATARGNMHHDPTMYAARDWVTWGVAAALIFVVLAARTGLPLH